MSSRNPWLDQTKGIACLLIVCHHLAFYGPMADVVKPLAPALFDWLYDYARMAVQVFLVLGGYWAAAGLAPQGQARHAQVLPLWGKRFARLVLPFAVALAVTMLTTEVVREWGFSHASMSDAPSWPQLLAHLFLLHGIGGWESLSAGVWYVAIDFQLYALVAWLVWCGQRAGQGRTWAGMTLAQGAVLVLAAASLWGWNRDSSWDNWALYFVGAYGLGTLAWWAAHSTQAIARTGWVLVIVVLGVVALWVEWRTRIALALLTALVLALASRVQWPAAVRQWRWAPLQQLGQMSYSVFLIHFSTNVLVNAVVTLLWPHSLWANALGLMAAVVLAVAAGAVLYGAIEKRSASWKKVLGWQVGTMGVGAAMALNVI